MECLEEDCTERTYAKGRCERHYRREYMRKRMGYNVYGPTRYCVLDGCSRRLRSDNKSGYCRYHTGYKNFSTSTLGRKSSSDEERRAKYLAAKKRDYEKHKEARLAQQRERFANSPALTEARREYRREYYLNNSDKIKERVKEYRKANPEIKSAAEGRRRARIAVRMDAIDRLLSSEYRKCIKDDPCYYCGAMSAQTDHYYPLAKGGTDHWYNLVRACDFCNNQKNATCGTRYLLRK